MMWSCLDEKKMLWCYDDYSLRATSCGLYFTLAASFARACSSFGGEACSRLLFVLQTHHDQDGDDHDQGGDDHDQYGDGHDQGGDDLDQDGDDH